MMQHGCSTSVKVQRHRGATTVRRGASWPVLRPEPVTFSVTTADQRGAGIGAGLQVIRVHYSPPGSKVTAARRAAGIGASRDGGEAKTPRHGGYRTEASKRAMRLELTTFTLAT